MAKKQKYSPNNRYSEKLPGDEDVELVNLDVDNDDADITPVPIDNFLEDEEILDLILVDSDANSNNEESDFQAIDIDQTIDDIDLDLQAENAHQFSVEPVDDEEVDTFPDQLMAAKRLDEDAPDIDIALPLEDLTVDIEKERVDLEPIDQEKSQDQKAENAAALLLIKQALLEDKDFSASLAKDIPAFKPYIPPVTQVNTTHQLYNIALIILVLMVLGLSAKVYMLTNEVSKLQLLTSILEEDVSLLQEKKTTNIPPVSQLSPEPTLPENKVVGEVVKPVESATPKVVTEQKKKPQTLPKQPSLKPATKPDVESSSNKHVSKAPVKKNNLTVKWAVNIVAFKNEIEAKKKSSKLIAQGIPVKVTAFKASNGLWYQLKVNGFKTRDNAESYASKLRKSINLNSISAVVN